MDVAINEVGNERICHDDDDDDDDNNGDNEDENCKSREMVKLYLFRIFYSCFLRLDEFRFLERTGLKICHVQPAKKWFLDSARNN